MNNKLTIWNHQEIRKKKQWKDKWHPFPGKKSKIYIKTHKVTNAPKLIGWSKPPVSKDKMVGKLELIYLFLSGVTGASRTLEKNTPRKENNMKSLAMSPPRKGMFPNPDINMLWAEKYQSLSPELAKFIPVFK